VTSPDGRYTVIEVECLGACGFATPVQINDEYVESVTPERVPAILAALPRRAPAHQEGHHGLPPPAAPAGDAGPLEVLRRPEARTLKGWRDRGGYAALEKALGMDPVEVQNVVKESGLRGRGGAGFPTGVKWSFMKPDGKQHYLCCNADESEPGTFKDREIMRWTPHALVEGVALGAHAIYADTAYIYVRGEYTEPVARLEAAVREANEAGILGDNALGTGRQAAVHVHRGAGAYICGEETALMNSLEGRAATRASSRPSRRSPACSPSRPTINNVETLAAAPHIVNNGAEWYKAVRRPDNPRARDQAVLGVRQRRAPGNYEVALGFPFGEFLWDVCGGAPAGARSRP
jgi:NADH-quinone oxidoreductase subunit F